MKNKNRPTTGKIEIDEKTAEPRLVQVDIADIPAKSDGNDNGDGDKIDITFTSKKSDGKQLSMQNLFIPDSEKIIDKRQKRFKRILYIAFIVIVIAALAYTAYKDFSSDKPHASIGEIFDTLLVNWFYLPCAIFSLALAFFFKGLKLSFCAHHLTGKWHFKTCMETGIVGHYYNYVTPLAVGGQPFEIYYLSKHGVHGGVASSLPISTYFSSQFACTALGIAAILLLKANSLGIPDYYFSDSSLSVASGLAIVGIILGMILPLVVVIFCVMPRLGATLVRGFVWCGGKLHLLKHPEQTMYKTMRTVINNSLCLKKITANPLVFTVSLLLSLAEQLAMMSIAYFTLRFFGFDIVGVGGFREWLLIIQICIILSSAVSFIPTPGNSVAADLTFFFLFEKGLVGSMAFPAMLSWRLLSYYSVLIIGFTFLTIKKNSERRLNRK